MMTTGEMAVVTFPAAERMLHHLPICEGGYRITAHGAYCRTPVTSQMKEAIQAFFANGKRIELKIVDIIKVPPCWKYVTCLT